LQPSLAFPEFFPFPVDLVQFALLRRDAEALLCLGPRLLRDALEQQRVLLCHEGFDAVADPLGDAFFPVFFLCNGDGHGMSFHWGLVLGCWQVQEQVTVCGNWS